MVGNISGFPFFCEPFISDLESCDLSLRQLRGEIKAHEHKASLNETVNVKDIEHIGFQTYDSFKGVFLK